MTPHEHEGLALEADPELAQERCKLMPGLLATGCVLLALFVLVAVFGLIIPSVSAAGGCGGG